MSIEGPLPPSVAAGNPVTAEVGAQILDEGGCAADAAVAMVLTACVAETVFTGLAGGGFAIYHDAATSETTCLDFFVCVPGLAGRRETRAQEIAIDFGGQLVPYAVGPATVAVPGVPAGMAALHERWGRLPWRQVVEPAAAHAGRGVSFAPLHSKVLATVAPAMLLGEGGRVYARDGKVLPGGARLFHPGLEAAMRALADEGAEAFYTGSVAESIVTAIGMNGDLSYADLAAYQVEESTPRQVELGPAIVRARGDDLDDLLGTIGALVLDPDPEVMATRLVDALRMPAHRGDTTNAAVVDHDRNICAVTTSLGLASGVWLADYGLHLNSMLGESELIRGTERPGRRLGSMMSPLIVFQDADPMLVAGAAGGSRIRSALLQVVVNVVHGGLGVADAIVAPRLNPVPGKVHVEPGFAPEVLQALSTRDEVVAWPGLDAYFGGVSAIGTTGPGADPRRGGDVRRLAEVG
ncbi:MAG TPA: gamma-glutamyltransferase [Nocardioidaceae bacterium]